MSIRSNVASKKEEDYDFFEFTRAKLRQDPRPVLNLSSSSDEEELTSGNSDQFDSDDPDSLSIDLYSKLQRQFSSLTVQTNFSNNGNNCNDHLLIKRSTRPRLVPGKYLLDESGRRWSTKPNLSIDQEKSILRPKHQEGRLSKFFSQKQLTDRSTQSILSLWQWFMPDRFLETYVLPWLNQKSTTPTAADGKKIEKEKSKGSISIDKTKTDLINLDELRAFFSILYARAASFDTKTNLENMWDSDCFSPSFFTGTMRKDRFFDLLKDFDFRAEKKTSKSQASIISDLSSTPNFVKEFNYRLLQCFEPGDTLSVFDRSIELKTNVGDQWAAKCKMFNLNSTSSLASASASVSENNTTKKVIVSWLRDSRCGFFIKMAEPVCKSAFNNMIIDMSRVTKADSSIHVRMDETLNCLVGQAPISGSGRTVYVGPLHAGVDCAVDLYDKHKLRSVGRLPSSGLRDCRVPFVAKSRLTLRRSIGSSLFVFDHPLSLISYQRRPASRAPEILISTAHFSKDKSEDGNNLENKQNLPSAWIDYQRFWKNIDDPLDNFFALFFNNRDDEIENGSLEKILFFDCLYAAGFNTFILWKLLQQPQQKIDDDVDDDKKIRYQFSKFLKLLSRQLAKSYVSKRLSSEENLFDESSIDSSNWRQAAKQILKEEEQFGDGSISDAGAAGGAGGQAKVGAASVATEDPPGSIPSSKKQGRKHTKKGGKFKK